MLHRISNEAWKGVVTIIIQYTLNAVKCSNELGSEASA
jgi:hypothetical protein